MLKLFSNWDSNRADSIGAGLMRTWKPWMYRSSKAIDLWAASVRLKITIEINFPVLLL